MSTNRTLSIETHSTRVATYVTDFIAVNIGWMLSITIGNLSIGCPLSVSSSYRSLDLRKHHTVSYRNSPLSNVDVVFDSITPDTSLRVRVGVLSIPDFCLSNYILDISLEYAIGNYIPESTCLRVMS
jgi:hypothetical protein